MLAIIQIVHIPAQAFSDYPIHHYPETDHGMSSNTETPPAISVTESVGRDHGVFVND
jgi:hypothetical protein